jgi:sulfatase maturation enzyme AslB (radical SAM superfamily)
MNCEYRRICGGGCPLTKMKLFGNVNKPSPLCDTFKKVFPYIIEMANQWKNKGKNLRW